MEPLKKRSNNFVREDEMCCRESRELGYFHVGRIHGLKYLGSGGKCQKLFWCCALMIALLCLLLSLWSVVGRREMSVMAPVREIPFPAITICPETKAQKSLFDVSEAYLDLVKNQSDDTYDDVALSRLEALTQVCDPHLFSSLNVSDSPTAGVKFVEILRELQVPQSKTFLFCKFRNELINCGKLFREIVIDDGLCYTFNLQSDADLFSSQEYRYDDNSSESQWNREAGYANANDFPRRASATYNYGLNVVLSVTASDLDFICKGPVQGFKVRVHAPDVLPNMMDGFFRIPMNSDIIVGVGARVEENDADCHSTRSKPLRFFNSYSQHNCMAECLSTFVDGECECTKFSMVRDNSTRVCTQHETQCVVHATDNFYSASRLSEGYPCDCRPSCVDYRYDFEQSDAVFDFKQVFKAYNESVDEEFPATIMSRLNVYFKSHHYEHKVQSNGKLGTLVSQLSQVGGIMAFFLGASILSIVEVVYHAIIRITKCFNN